MAKKANQEERQKWREKRIAGVFRRLTALGLAFLSRISIRLSTDTEHSPSDKRIHP